MTVVVVESPAKAKTINKYLGADFRVLASYGHIRDLPSKDGSVRPDDDFDMSWEVDSKSKKRIDILHCVLKVMNILPRQARGKYRESAPKRGRPFFAGR